MLNTDPGNMDIKQTKNGPHDTPAVDVNTGKSLVIKPANSIEEQPVQTETVDTADTNQLSTDTNNKADRITTVVSPRTASINDVSNMQKTSTGTNQDLSSLSINKQLDLDKADRRELHDAGLSPSHAKPSEKVYNEWITTFSDDSLFDEMTEDLKRNEQTNNTGKSPEQRAAEGLLLLRNQTNHDSNETLMPVDAPKLPDLVLEMDAEKEKSTNVMNTTTDNSNMALTKETDSNANEKPKEKNAKNNDKTTSKTKQTNKAESTKSPRKGVFQMRTIGLRKHTSPTHRIVKKIGCSLCKRKFDNRTELKTHHQEDHNILTCDKCGKSFSTKKSLTKHLYKHSDLPWKCKKCGEGFAFSSELRAHLVKHETEPMFKCNIIGCNKEYMRQSELTAHMKTHDGTIHKCPEDGCVYEAIDIRYLKNHMRVHSDDLPYPCKECDQSFKHFMQRKRHYKNEHS